MENRNTIYVPTTQDNGKWSDLPKSINFMNETSSMNLCKLAVALARKYQAEESGVISESSPTMFNHDPTNAAHLSCLERENYKTDELIIKTEFSETETEATSAVVNESSRVEPVDLQNMSKLVIKTEVFDASSDPTSAPILSFQNAEDPEIKTDVHARAFQNFDSFVGTNFEQATKWDFAENKDTLKESALPFSTYQQISSVVPVKEKKRPMTAAERARNMRARKRLLKVKKRPMTASERVKKCRELKKAAKKAIPFEVIAVNSNSSNFATTDHAFYAQQYLNLNHDAHSYGSNQYLDPFNTNAFAQNSNLVDGLVTEIKCEPSIDLDILEDYEKPLEICTELFCEPIIEGNTANELSNSPQQQQQQPLLDVEDYSVKRMGTSAERTRKYRGLKKAMANTVPFETPSITSEPEIAHNVHAKAFKDGLWMFQDSNLKPTAMTAAERMRRYRQRKKDEEQKNKTLEENFDAID